MPRWNSLPEEVNTSLACALLKVLCDFRAFFIKHSKIQVFEVRFEYEFFLPKVQDCFKSGMLLWIRTLERDFELGLSNNYRSEGMLLSRGESQNFLQQQVELLAPREIANLIGKSATELSFLQYEVAKKARRAQSPEARKFLWALHDLIARSIRDLVASGMFMHFPNTPHGERFPEQITQAVSGCLFEEFLKIQSFRAGLAEMPRDILSALLADPLFEVFAENWNRIRLLVPSDVDRWLKLRYPIHRRAMPARIASSIGRSGRRSVILRIQLANRWELSDPAAYSTAEDVGSIFNHKLLRTGALESFPQ